MRKQMFHALKSPQFRLKQVYSAPLGFENRHICNSKMFRPSINSRAAPLNLVLEQHFRYPFQLDLISCDFTCCKWITVSLLGSCIFKEAWEPQLFIGSRVKLQIFGSNWEGSLKCCSRIRFKGAALELMITYVYSSLNASSDKHEYIGAFSDWFLASCEIKHLIRSVAALRYWHAPIVEHVAQRCFRVNQIGWHLPLFLGRIAQLMLKFCSVLAIIIPVFKVQAYYLS